MRTSPSRRQLAAGFCVVAVLYGVVLLLGVIVVPSVDGETLLQYGGPWSLAIFAQPLVVSAVMWRLLRRRCHAGGSADALALWTIAVVYVLYSILGGFTIAAGSLPAALLILLAVMLTPRVPAAAAARSAR